MLFEKQKRGNNKKIRKKEENGFSIAIFQYSHYWYSGFNIMPNFTPALEFWRF